MWKKWYKIITITTAENTEHVYHVTMQTCILLMLPSLKTKIKMAAAKEWTDGETFQFRNYLLWNRLGGNYFL